MIFFASSTLRRTSVSISSLLLSNSSSTLFATSSSILSLAFSSMDFCCMSFIRLCLSISANFCTSLFFLCLCCLCCESDSELLDEELVEYLLLLCLLSLDLCLRLLLSSRDLDRVLLLLDFLVVFSLLKLSLGDFSGLSLLSLGIMTASIYVLKSFSENN